MKIHAFSVQQLGALSFDDVIDHIAGRQLDERMQTVFNDRMRLEAEQRTRNGWFLDFSEIRREGPGRCPPDRPIEDFEMDDEDGFGEETAVYYHIPSNYMVVQYNHRGAKAGGIQNYLFEYGQRIEAQHGIAGTGQFGFLFASVLRQGALARLDQAGWMREVELAVHVPAITASEAARRSFGGILDNPLVAGAQTMNLTLGVGRDRQGTLGTRDIRRMVRSLLPFAGEAVRTLRVTARHDENGPSDVIDFVRERLEANAVVTAPANSRRPLRTDRWRALEIAFQNWRDSGDLP